MLSIITVNYFGGETLARCLQSVIDNTIGIDYEMLVADNSRDAATRVMVQNLGKEIRWIDMEYNAGFGRANNRCFELMKGDTALLLNPDCIASDNVIGQAYQQLTAADYIGCGVQLLNEDGSHQISGHYAMRGGLNYLLPLPYLGKAIKFLGQMTGTKAPHLKQGNKIEKVDWITGAFLMVKKEGILKSNGFDPDFFLYGEEAEWCHRLRKYGDLVIFTDLAITHLQGTLATKAFEGEDAGYYTLHDKKGKQIMLSNFLRIRKEFGLFWFLVVVFFYYLSIPVFLFAGAVHSLLTMRNQLSTFQGLTNNLFRLFPDIFDILTAKHKLYKVL